jgi:hypothetical protein
MNILGDKGGIFTASSRTRTRLLSEDTVKGCVVCVCVRCATHHNRQHSDTVLT